MKASLHIYMLLMLCTLHQACSTELEGPQSALHPQEIYAMDIDSVLNVVDITPGDGVVLLTYLDLEDFYHFVLISNDGEILWKRLFKSRLIPPNDDVRFIQVRRMPDGSFGALYGDGFYFISLEGEISDQPDITFENLAAQNMHTYLRVREDGSFLLAGSIVLGGNRGFIAAHAADGSMLYRRTLLINVNGRTTYTASAPLADGGFLFAGSFESPNEGLQNGYFVTKLSKEGEILWTKTYDTHPFENFVQSAFIPSTIPGRNMLRLHNATFAYLLNPQGPDFEEQRFRLVYFDEEGDETRPHEFINHASINTTNFVIGTARDAMALNADGTITGLATTSYPVNQGNTNLTPPLSITTPVQSYFFDLNAEGDLVNSVDIDRNYSNSFTAIAPLSNGRTMIAGTQLALGVDLKLILIIR